MLIVAILAGCGDSADSSSDGGDAIAVETGSLTKSQFVERANAICKEGRAQFEDEFNAYIKRHGGEFTKSRLPQQASEVVSEIYLPANEGQIDRIRALGAPEGDEREVVAILAAMQSGLDEASDSPVEFLRGFSPRDQPFAKAERLASEYGMTSCGRG